MISNISDLAEHLGAARDDAKAVARRLYKDTDCGIGFEEVEGGVEIAGYAEGSNGECPNHRLTYPFTPEDFDSAVEEADREGCEAWDEANLDENEDE